MRTSAVAIVLFAIAAAAFNAQAKTWHVDAATATVYVCAGTYNERVTINGKTLDIQGGYDRQFAGRDQAKHKTIIDAGDPAADHSGEPAPNGRRINLGAYSNTERASRAKK